MNLFTLTGEILLEGADEAQRDIKDVTSTVETEEPKLGNAFKKIATAVAGAFAIDKIKDFGIAIVNASAEVSAEQSAFSQIMGDYADTASSKLQSIADSTGVETGRIMSSFTSMSAKFKGLGYDVDEATDLATRGLTLASDASAFWDKSLDDTVSALNSFMNGSYEAGESIGLFANDTQMAAYAVKQGLVATTTEWSALDEATKQATRLEYAELMYQQSGAIGQASRESDQYANVQGNLTEKWRQFKAEIGEPLLQNVVIPAMQKLSDVVDVLSSGWEKLKTWIDENNDTINTWVTILTVAGTAIGAYVIAVNTMSVIQTVTKWLDGMTIAQKLLNVAMSANPVGLVVSAITGLIAILVTLYNKCETFRNFVDGFFEDIKTACITAWEDIKSVFSGVITFFSDLWSDIKECFDFTDIFNIGVNLVQGLWNGISSVKDWIVDKVKGFGSSVLSGIKDFFGIHSPSTVMAEVGKFFVEGFNVGINSSTPSTIKAVNKITTKAVAVADGGFKKTAKIAEETVEEVTDEVEEGGEKTVKTLSEKLKNVASTMSSYCSKYLGYLTDLGDAIYDYQDQQYENQLNALDEEIEALKNAREEKIAIAQSEHDKKLSILDDQLNQGLISQEEYNTKKTQLEQNLADTVDGIKTESSETEKKLAKEQDALARKQFEAKKKSEIANVWINFATATMRAFAENFWAVALGITTALGVQAGIQTATINSQQYTSAFAEGGIIDEPTIGLVGEAGKEAVVPLENNTEWVGGLAKAISPAIVSQSSSNEKAIEYLREEVVTLRRMLSETLNKILDKDTSVILDGNQLAFALAPSIDSNLGTINRYKNRGI